MAWYGWIVVGFLALGAVLTVWGVGKPRDPLRGDVAACTVVLSSLLILAVLKLGGAV